MNPMKSNKTEVREIITYYDCQSTMNRQIFDQFYPNTTIISGTNTRYLKYYIICHIWYPAYDMRLTICSGYKTHHFRVTSWRSSREDELFFNECQLSMWYERMVSSLLGDISEVTFRMESKFKLIHSRLWVMRISL